MTNITETVAGLRALADFLEQHPELPAPFTIEARPHLNGTDQDNDREVDRIAGILDEQPRYSPRAHYTVEQSFGGGVSYRAISIPQALMDQWGRDSTYHGTVQP